MLGLIDRGGGGGTVHPGDVPAVAPPAVMEPSEKEDRSEMYAKMADDCITWAAMSIVENRPGPVPPRLPTAMRNWLAGLSAEQCKCLILATPEQVSTHLLGQIAIDGVPKVQRLSPSKEWPEPATDEPFAGDDVNVSASPQPS